MNRGDADARVLAAPQPEHEPGAQRDREHVESVHHALWRQDQAVVSCKKAWHSTVQSNG